MKTKVMEYMLHGTAPAGVATLDTAIQVLRLADDITTTMKASL